MIEVTTQEQRVLAQFLLDGRRPRFAMELMDSTGLSSGTLYPILMRFTRLGWLIREREDIDPVKAGRPARRCYWIDRGHAQQLEGLFAAADE
jgi:DNA-binding PadR family transcriptional regulator